MLAALWVDVLFLSSRGEGNLSRELKQRSRELICHFSDLLSHLKDAVYIDDPQKLLQSK